MPKATIAAQKKNAEARQKTKEKSYGKNFYAFDSETNGFKHNEVVELAAILYQDG